MNNKLRQCAKNFFVIKPIAFNYNEETSLNNKFQNRNIGNPKIIQLKALREFEAFVDKLLQHNIDVEVIEDLKYPVTPDSIFPNNWISFHENEIIVLYPMYAKNRRLEKNKGLSNPILKNKIIDKQIIDYSIFEDLDLYLEGTGSIIFDRVNRLAFCSISARTNESIFIKLCSELSYDPVIFRSYHTVNKQKHLIYHTNVMLSISENFSIICLDSIPEGRQKENVINFLSVRDIITITDKQLSCFAGNTLGVKNISGDDFLVISEKAYKSLDKNQINKINKYVEMIVCDIKTIEQYGGGSVRCMLAEIF